MRKIITTTALCAAALMLSACNEPLGTTTFGTNTNTVTTVPTTGTITTTAVNAGAVTIPTTTTTTIAQPVYSTTTVAPVSSNFIIRGTSFALNSDNLLSSGRSQLNTVAQTMLSQGGTYNITGYASTEGDAGYNQSLSERRARSVAAYLVGKGVPSSSLNSSGAGETTQFGSDLASNRRVQISQAGGSFSTGSYEVISSTPIYDQPVTTISQPIVTSTAPVVSQVTVPQFNVPTVTISQ